MVSDANTGMESVIGGKAGAFLDELKHPNSSSYP